LRDYKHIEPDTIQLTLEYSPNRLFMVELIKHDNEYVISNTKYISRSNFRTRMFVVARPNPFMHRSISPIMNTNNNIY